MGCEPTFTTVYGKLAHRCAHIGKHGFVTVCGEILPAAVGTGGHPAALCGRCHRDPAS